MYFLDNASKRITKIFQGVERELEIKVKEKYKKEEIDTTDGVKILFDKDWVHLRKSNTEPIIRIYAESSSINTADSLAKKIIQDIGKFLN